MTRSGDCISLGDISKSCDGAQVLTLPETPEECVAFYETWAAEYPTARFLVVAISPQGNDAEPLGWGMATPEYVFADLAELGLSGRFRTARSLLKVVRHGELDVRIVWVDPEPPVWREEEDWWEFSPSQRHPGR